MSEALPFDTLYNQALLEIAQTLQKSGYVCRSAWYARKSGSSSLVLGVQVTVRVAATRRLYDTLMLVLTHDVTSKSVLARANRAAACRALGFSAGDFQALIKGGMPHVMARRHAELALKFTAHGVTERVAHLLVAHITQHRDEIIAYLNSTDDVGCEPLASLASPSPQ